MKERMDVDRNPFVTSSSSLSERPIRPKKRSKRSHEIEAPHPPPPSPPPPQPTVSSTVEEQSSADNGRNALIPEIVHPFEGAYFPEMIYIPEVIFIPEYVPVPEGAQVVYDFGAAYEAPSVSPLPAPVAGNVNTDVDMQAPHALVHPVPHLALPFGEPASDANGSEANLTGFPVDATIEQFVQWLAAVSAGLDAEIEASKSKPVPQTHVCMDIQDDEQEGRPRRVCQCPPRRDIPTKEVGTLDMDRMGLWKVICRARVDSVCVYS